MSYDLELKLARRAALAAGDYLAGLSEKEIESSIGRDIKLKADKAAEEIILETLRPSACPVVSEESPDSEARVAFGLRWIIDPLDGTFNYYKGLDDLCCVSVALWNDNDPVLGVVYKFGTGELFEGGPGGGARLNGQSCRPSQVARPEEACLGTGFPVKSDFSDDRLKENLKYIQTFKKVRLLGSAALMSAYVGAGRLDAYFEKGIFIWDIAAGAAIVAASGGWVSFTPGGGQQGDCCCFANERLKEACRGL